MPTGFRISGDGADRIADDAWEAAHWVLAAALGRAVEGSPGGIVLHSGAALIGGRAVLFAGPSHAGKSAVGLHLAALGLPLLGDDRVILPRPVRDVVATGLARKIRVPLPSDFAPAARRLAETSRAGHAAGADVLAWDRRIDRPIGTAAPLARIVVLSRDPGLGAVRMVRLGAAEALATLLPLCGRHAGSAADLLDAVAGLVATIPTDRLEAPCSAAAAEAIATAA